MYIFIITARTSPLSSNDGAELALKAAQMFEFANEINLKKGGFETIRKRVYAKCYGGSLAFSCEDRHRAEFILRELYQSLRNSETHCIRVMDEYGNALAFDATGGFMPTEPVDLF